MATVCPEKDSLGTWISPRATLGRDDYGMGYGMLRLVEMTEKLFGAHRSLRAASLGRDDGGEVYFVISSEVEKSMSQK